MGRSRHFVWGEGSLVLGSVCRSASAALIHDDILSRGGGHELSTAGARIEAPRGAIPIKFLTFWLKWYILAFILTQLPMQFTKITRPIEQAKKISDK